MFVFLSDMQEEMAYLVFTAIHVPMYILFFWGLFGTVSGVNRNLIIGSNLFFIVHVLLHILFLKHPLYQFKSGFSWGLILGCGLSGAIDLLMSF